MLDFLRKQEDKKVWWLVGASVVFFFVYLFLHLGLPGFGGNHLILNQPDEGVNYFFIKQLVFEDQFRVPEELSTLTLNQVHPRSVTVVHGALTPIGFPGIILLFSCILKIFVFIFGRGTFNYFVVSLTPLMAVLTTFLFYGFIKRVWGERVGFISALLLYVMPGWWYYSSRVFSPNTWFVFLLISGLYFGARCLEVSRRDVAVLEKRDVAVLRLYRYLFAFLSGLGFSLSVYIRPAEMLWVGLLILILFILTLRKNRLPQFISFQVGASISTVLFFVTQLVYYGSWLGTGYMKPDASGAAGTLADGNIWLSLVRNLTFPFGVSLRGVVVNGYHYLLNLFPAWGLVVCVSIILAGYRVYKKGKVKKEKWYLILFLSFSLYLLVFYGSWIFSDNLLQLPSIGTSYVRYFLPVYVFSLPFLASLLSRAFLVKKIKWATTMLVIVLFISSLYSVYFGLEGLYPVRRVVANYSSWQQEIYNLTEPGSVIVTHYGDKYIFPGRKVIPGFELWQRREAVRNLLEQGTPVYLYDLILSPEDEQLFAEYNLKLSDPLFLVEDLQLREIQF